MTTAELSEFQRESTIQAMIRRGECPEDAFPDEYGKDIPDEGAWIMLLQSVHVGKLGDDGHTKHITIPHLSMWYAMLHISNSRVLLHDLGTKRRRYRRDEKYVHLKQAVIITHDGPVHIWPHEYSKVDINKFLEFCEDDGLNIHYMTEEARVDESGLFYLRSRGIGKAEAQRMLLGTLKNPNYCYFTFSSDIAECFGEGAGSMHLHSVNPQRRLEARSRK